MPAEALVEAVVAALVAAVVLGPALGRGHLLRHDLVSVPRPVLTPDTLGLGDRLPRAVPWDAAVAVVARVVPGGYPIALAALLALVAVGAGTARLARPAGPGRWIALLVAVWNPFVLEQLAIGHVPHLLGYAAVPWVALGVAGVASGASRSWPGLVLAVAAGSLTPGGGILCVVTALAVAAGAGGRAARRAAAVLVVAVLQAPWAVAGTLHPATSTSTSAGAAAAAELFGVRAQSPAGVVVDTLGLGGLWAADVLPPGRTGWWSLAATVLLLGLALVGARPAARSIDRRWVVVAGGLAAGGYLVALLPHLPGGGHLLRLLVDHAPGAALLRDGHRWLAWPALLVAVLVGHGAARLAGLAVRRAPRLTAGSVAAPLVVVAAAVIAVLPDLAWGLRGRLVPVAYPEGWAQARAVLDAADDGDRVLVLPWQPFRRFSWAGSVPVLDPAPRLLPRPALADDALPLAGARLPAEGAGSRAVAAALADGALDAAELSTLGVRWVFVERGTPGALPALPAPVAVEVSDEDVTLLRFAAPDRLPTDPAVRRLVVTLAHGVFGVAVLGAAASLAVAHAPRRERRPGSRRRSRTGNLR